MDDYNSRRRDRHGWVIRCEPSPQGLLPGASPLPLRSTATKPARATPQSYTGESQARPFQPQSLAALRTVLGWRHQALGWFRPGNTSVVVVLRRQCRVHIAPFQSGAGFGSFVLPENEYFSSRSRQDNITHVRVVRCQRFCTVVIN